MVCMSVSVESLINPGVLPDDAAVVAARQPQPAAIWQPNCRADLKRQVAVLITAKKSTYTAVGSNGAGAFIVVVHTYTEISRLVPTCWRILATCV